MRPRRTRAAIVALLAAAAVASPGVTLPAHPVRLVLRFDYLGAAAHTVAVTEVQMPGGVTFGAPGRWPALLDQGDALWKLAGALSGHPPGGTAR